MQFPSFWVKIFFFNFLKNVILQFGPFLLSMPHMSFINVDEKNNLRYHCHHYEHLQLICQYTIKMVEYLILIFHHIQLTKVKQVLYYLINNSNNKNDY